MSETKTKRIFSVASKVLTWIVIAIAVFMMIFTIFSTLMFNKNDRSLFGVKIYVVLTDSMSKPDDREYDGIHFNAGDLVLAKDVEDKTKFRPGDVITFISQNPDSSGKTITHMIHDVVIENGELRYKTYGINTGEIDTASVDPDFILGKYEGKIPVVGRFFNFLKTTPGYIVCILIPFLLLIIWQGMNTVRLFRRYRQEQMADMKAERQKLADEREESLRMMRELQALREQLANSAAASSTASAPPAETENSSEIKSDTNDNQVDNQNN